MRLIPWLVAVTALFLLPIAAAEEEPKKKSKAKPPPAGIWWERDLKAGMARAAREGRPMLFCVNALETERANQRLGLSTYRTAAWGDATRGFVNFVCNPEAHGEDPCSRYERHVCKGHREALTWFLKRFGQNLISPQHVILEPDGDVAYRKEYYTGVVGPVLFENYLSHVAPPIAYSRAGIGRESKLKACAELPLPELDAFAKRWLDGKDGLAAAAMLNALDDCYDTDRRLALIAALKHTHDLQAAVLPIAAEERVLYPGDEPKETDAWVETLFAVDRKLGVWAATRVIARSNDAVVRDRMMRIWAGPNLASKSAPILIDELPESERPFAYEALLLAGDQRAKKDKVPGAWVAGREREIARARLKAGRVTGGISLDLKAALEAKDPGILRAALLAATPEQVRTHAEALMKGMNTWRADRLRIAAALALWKARAGPPVELAERLYRGANDVVEARPTREALDAIMGAGTVEHAMGRAGWLAAMDAWWKGGAK